MLASSRVQSIDWAWESPAAPWYIAKAKVCVVVLSQKAPE